MCLGKLHVLAETNVGPAGDVGNVGNAGDAGDSDLAWSGYPVTVLS